MSVDRLLSRPLLAVLRGMSEPDVWRSESQSLSGRDFLAGMTRAGDMANISAMGGASVAVASTEYLNLSLRLGYHFNMLDCYCSETPRNNHILFRFVGGAATITSRSLRILFMSRVMSAYGFLIKSQEDLLVARISNLPAPELEKLLTGVGRLIGFARQLDAELKSEESAERLAMDFLVRSPS